MRGAREFVLDLHEDNWKQVLDKLCKSPDGADFDLFLDCIIFEHSREFEETGRIRYCTAWYWLIVDSLRLIPNRGTDKETLEYARTILCQDIKRFVTGFRKSKQRRSLDGFYKFLARCAYNERRKDISTRTFSSLNKRGISNNLEEAVSKRTGVSVSSEVLAEFEENRETGIHEQFLDFLGRLADGFSTADARWVVLLSICWRVQLTVAQWITGDPLINYLDEAIRFQLADKINWKILRNVDLINEYWYRHSQYLMKVQREQKMLAQKWGSVLAERKKNVSPEYLEKLTKRYLKMRNHQLQLKTKTVVELLRLDEMSIGVTLLSQKFSLSRSFLWRVWQQEVPVSQWKDLFYQQVMRRRIHGTKQMPF